MKALILLTVFTVLVLAITTKGNSCSSTNFRVKSRWEVFKIQYSKSYKGAQEITRFIKFSKNLAAIVQHNSEETHGQHNYKLGLNEYADMGIDEVRRWMNGYKRPVGLARSGFLYLTPAGLLDLPDTVDWRKRGWVTPVKNQGLCGSCYAFSATGSLEGQHFRATGNLVSLSEQNLIDCSRNDGTRGCNGGWTAKAFDFIQQNEGIDTERSYPYKAKDDMPCRFKKENIGASLVTYMGLPLDNEQKLKEAVASVGPISIGVDASHKSFQLYDSGVYIEPECSSVHLDHAMLVVGYGSEKGQDYWLVKNSWGMTWGENGYIKMTRNSNNHCGVASFPIYPVV